MDKNIEKQRNSNLEILRIIAMIFIISFHLTRHGFDGVDFVISNYNNIFLYFFGTLGKLGVDIFILISAYFMVKNKFTFRKLLILGGEVYFYSILFLIIFTLLLVPTVPLSIDLIINSILPISHGYWFIADYIALMLISPFINLLIYNLSKTNFLKLFSIVLLLWCVYPTFTGDCFHVSEMIFFVILYFIGGFIRLYVDLDKINMKKLILICFLSLIITSILFGIFDSISPLNQLAFFNKETSIFKRAYSVFILISALSLFMIFLKKRYFSNIYINYISGSVLGVYLIHSNTFVIYYILDSILHIRDYYFSSNLFLIMILSIISIYMICTGIDIVRRLTIEKIWIRVIDNKYDVILCWFNRKFTQFENKIGYYLK